MSKKVFLLTCFCVGSFLTQLMKSIHFLYLNKQNKKNLYKNLPFILPNRLYQTHYYHHHYHHLMNFLKNFQISLNVLIDDKLDFQALSTKIYNFFLKKNWHHSH